MCLVAALILVCGGVLTGVLFPRNINLSVVSVNSTTHLINIGPTANITGNNTIPILQIQVSHINDVELQYCGVNNCYDINFQTAVKIKNSNFFPVKVNTLNVTLTYQGIQVGLKAIDSFSVSSQSSQVVSASLFTRVREEETNQCFGVCVCVCRSSLHKMLPFGVQLIQT